VILKTKLREEKKREKIKTRKKKRKILKYETKNECIFSLLKRYISKEMLIRNKARRKKEFMKSIVRKPMFPQKKWKL